MIKCMFTWDEAGMTKDTCLPQDLENTQSLQSLHLQKIPQTTRSIRITHSHARDNTIK
jgi:hypothetical protein